MNHSTNTQRKFPLWASLCADLLKAPSICLDIPKKAEWLRKTALSRVGGGAGGLPDVSIFSHAY